MPDALSPPIPTPQKSPKRLITIFVLAAVVMIIGGVILIERNIHWQEKLAMESVIAQTNLLTAQFASRNSVPSQDWMPYYDRLGQDMQAIDISGCPHDFKDKYAAVIKAWQEVLGELDNTVHQFGVKVIAGHGMPDLDSALSGSKPLNDAVKRYKDAWGVLSQCAGEYGLQLSVPKESKGRAIQ